MLNKNSILTFVDEVADVDVDEDADVDAEEVDAAVVVYA